MVAAVWLFVFVWWLPVVAFFCFWLEPEIYCITSWQKRYPLLEELPQGCCSAHIATCGELFESAAPSTMQATRYATRQSRHRDSKGVSGGAIHGRDSKRVWFQTSWSADGTCNIQQKTKKKPKHFINSSPRHKCFECCSSFSSLQMPIDKGGYYGLYQGDPTGGPIGNRLWPHSFWQLSHQSLIVSWPEKHRKKSTTSILRNVLMILY